MGIFNDNARQLWECGLSIIPVEPNSKRAIVSYDLYREEKVSEEILNQWENKYPNYNIGLVTGKASQLVGIDLDTKDKDLLSKCLKLLPRSPLQKFGSKGLTIFVRWSGQTGRKIYYKGQSIGEFIVNTQIVIPPSIHPETKKPYEWTSYLTMGDEDINNYIDDIPQFTNKDLDLFEKQLDSEDIELSKDFFDQKFGRNDKLKSICGSLFNQGLLPEDIAPILLAEDLNLHADKSLFKDKEEFKDMSSQPLACAYRFASSIFITYMKSHSRRKEKLPQFDKQKEKEIMENSEYSKYKLFFEKNFKSPKKCKISGESLDLIGNIPLLMRTDALQSYSIDFGLKPARVSCHLNRYIEDLKAELLIKIPKWDGIDRVKKLCESVTLKEGDHSHFENYIKYWGSRVFARFENPDEQNIFIILKGDQGIGKDRFVKNLSKGFGRYYSKFLVQPNKEVDTIHQVASNLVLHLEEFDQTSKLGISFLKELVTSDEKTYRLPYDRCALRRKMYASFISTVNVENIFRDSTGNRRFAVFNLDKINWDYSKGDNDQIVAQFKFLYKSQYDLLTGAKQSMADKIKSMTPDGVDDELLDLWDTRVSNLIIKESSCDLKFEKVEPVIKDIRQVTGWKPQSVLSFLKQHKRSFKRGGHVYYTAGHRSDLL